MCGVHVTKSPANSDLLRYRIYDAWTLRQVTFGTNDD